MSHRVFAAGMVVLLFGFAAEPAAAQLLQASVRVVSGTAKVLSRPSAEADVVASVLLGTMLDVVDTDGTWYWVSLPPDGNGTARRGWIPARDVQAVAADVSAVIHDLNQKVEQLQQQVQTLQPNAKPKSAAIAPPVPNLARVEADRREVERARREYEAAAQPAAQTDLHPVSQALTPPAPFASQNSYSSKFFLGGGVEGNAMVTDPYGNQNSESGRGAGLVLGYGFSPRWALYGQFSGASINAFDGGTYALAHVDIGTRVHFLAGRAGSFPSFSSAFLGAL